MIDLVVIDSTQNHTVPHVILNPQAGQPKSINCDRGRSRSNCDSRTCQASPIKNRTLAALNGNVILCDKNILLVRSRRDANYIPWLSSIYCGLNRGSNNDDVGL